MKKIIAVTLTLVLGLVSLSGCSTIAGAGKDLQSAGKVITNEAQRAK